MGSCVDAMWDLRRISYSSEPSESEVSACFLNSGKISVTISSKMSSCVFSSFLWGLLLYPCRCCPAQCLVFFYKSPFLISPPDSCRASSAYQSSYLLIHFLSMSNLSFDPFIFVPTHIFFYLVSPIGSL